MKSIESTQRLFNCGAGLLLALAVIYAPWAWGCVWPRPLAGLEVILAASGGLWILSRVGNARSVALPRLLLVCIGWILLQGWFMALNAHHAYNSVTHQLMATHEWVAFLPGASDQSLAMASMRHITLLLLALLIAYDLLAQRWWRDFFWNLIAVVGASVAVYGLLARAGIMPPMVVQPSFPTSPFGPFNYHGIAGAFLNLTIPAQLGLAAIWLSRPGHWAKGIFHTLLALATISGVLINVSRGAALIGLMEAATFLFFFIRQYRRSDQFSRKYRTRNYTGPIALVAGAVVVLFVGFIAVTGPASRWSSFANYFDTLHSSRVLAWRVAWGMMTTHPFFGSGAGSFKVRFPISHHWIQSLYSHWIQTFYHPGHHISQWSYASNDYLQNLVQFGWVGAAAWAGILFGWIWQMRKVGLFFNLPPMSVDAIFRLCACIGLLGVLVHATFDYPLEIASLQLYAVFHLAALYQRNPPMPPEKKRP